MEATVAKECIAIIKDCYHIQSRGSPPQMDHWLTAKKELLAVSQRSPSVHSSIKHLIDSARYKVIPYDYERLQKANLDQERSLLNSLECYVEPKRSVMSDVHHNPASPSTPRQPSGRKMPGLVASSSSVSSSSSSDSSPGQSPYLPMRPRRLYTSDNNDDDDDNVKPALARALLEVSQKALEITDLQASLAKKVTEVSDQRRSFKDKMDEMAQLTSLGFAIGDPENADAARMHDKLTQFVDDQERSPALRSLSSFALQSMEDADLSYKYQARSYLDFNDSITKSERLFFMDSYVRRPTLTLNDARSAPFEKGRLEYVIVDLIEDKALMPFIQDVARKVRGKDLKSVISIIGKMIDERLGGNEHGIVERSEAHIESMMKLLKARAIPLGDIRFGVCRHRALLFKVVADYLEVPTRIVSGMYHFKDRKGGHAWNVVEVDGEYWLVDIMHEPGRLWKLDGSKAAHYKRTGGGVGGESITGASPKNIRQSDVTLGNLLGQGNNSVYEATIDKGKYALKEIIKPKLDEDRARAKREMEIHRQLKHPNVVVFTECIDANKHGRDFFWLITEKMDCSLDQMVYDLQPMDMLVYLLNISSALWYLHRLKIVHRDIKPANILIDKTKKLAKLGDFGLSKLLDLNRSNTLLLGSQNYMAPELDERHAERGEANEKVDVYAFGWTMGELVTQLKPKATPGKRLEAMIDTERTIRASLPALADLFRHCVEENPAKRPDFLSISRQLAKILTMERIAELNE